MPPKKPTTDQLPLDGTAPDPAAPFKPYPKGEALVPEPQAAPLVPLQPPGPADDIMGLLRMALDKGVPVEALEKLQGLYERSADRAARAEFAAAFAAFQGECPTIPRSAKVDYLTSKGARVAYDYSDLAAIVTTAGPVAHRHGFSWTWDADDLAGKLKVTCILQHVNGIEKRSSFTIPISQSDRMSLSQNTNSAATVARRQSLVAVLGLVSVDPDDDGSGVTSETITDAQINALDVLIKETGADFTKFLKWAGVEEIGDIKAEAFDAAKLALEAKRRKV